MKTVEVNEADKAEDEVSVQRSASSAASGTLILGVSMHACVRVKWASSVHICATLHLRERLPGRRKRWGQEVSSEKRRKQEQLLLAAGSDPQP